MRKKIISPERLIHRLEAKQRKKIICKALIDSNISNQEFTLVINKEQNQFRLKKNIRTKDDQLSDIEQDRFIEHVKELGRMRE